MSQVGTVRCAVPVAERSVRRRNRMPNAPALGSSLRPLLNAGGDIPIIAQCFSIGVGEAKEPNPERTAESAVGISLNGPFQPSLRDLVSPFWEPNAEALGYSRSSLRDAENQISITLRDAEERILVWNSP